MCSPPRHYQFGEREEETVGECSKNYAHNSIEREKRRIEDREEEKKGRRKK